MRHAGLGLAVLLVLGGGAGLYANARDDAPPSAAPMSRPVAARVRSVAAPRTGAGLFGLNEGVTIPEMLIARGIVKPEQEAAILERAARDAVSVGVGILRANSANYPFVTQFALDRDGWDWRRADLWYQAVEAQGLEVNMVLGPWPGTRTANYTDHYVPADMLAYQSYVRRLVERYDGDGVDDMPGLKRGALSWEVDNEPDLHNSVPARDAKTKIDPATFQTPKQYAAVLVATAAAIREADPDAVVLNGGLYSGGTERGRAYMREVLAQPGAAQSFDILSLHCYFDADNLSLVDACIESARLLAPDKPYWITETGVPSDGRKPWADETWQARMVAAVYGSFLAAGAERVFWHTLTDPPTDALPGGNTKHPFSSHSLYKAQPGPDGAKSASGARVLKASGALYQRLARHMASADPTAIVEQAATGGRLLATGQGWLAFQGSPQAPKGASQAEDLLTGQTRAIRPGETVPAPAWIQ